MSNPGQDPAEGSRDTVEHELKRSDGHPEDKKGAAKATKENDLTTGHTREGDGGDANSN
jgi:hypothetical protein